MSEPRAKPTERAFVVQFRPGAGAGRPPRYPGRVEQVATGEAAHFHSLRELVGFLTRSLRGAAPRGARTEEREERR